MLIITGTIAYDYIMDFPGSFGDHILPEQIHKINLSFIVKQFARRRGGTAGNASYSLALLKTPHILFSYAGKDFGEYKKKFRELKINLKGIRIDEKEYTATGFAMTDKNDNQIWGYFYGAANKIPTLKLNDVAKKNDLILIGPSGAAGSVSFVKQCIKNKLSYMFDPGFILTEVTNADLQLGVENCKFLIGNDYEIDLIKSRIKNWNEIVKNKTIIKTLGKNGTEIIEQGKLFKVKPSLVKKPIDPSGAGDAWRSGFLAGLHKNFDIVTCAKMGSVAASFAVESYGTQEHAYSIGKFKNRYRQTYNSLLDL